MIKVKKEGIILRKRALDFESQGVLNPAVIQEGTLVYMFYRAVSKGNYSSIGFCQLDGPLTLNLSRVHDTTTGYVYSACAAPLDLENLEIEIARLPYPLFRPEAEWNYPVKRIVYAFTRVLPFLTILYISPTEQQMN